MKLRRQAEEFGRRQGTSGSLFKYLEGRVATPTCLLGARDSEVRQAEIGWQHDGLSPTDAARQVGLGRATVYKQKAQRARAGTAATHADS